MKVTGSSHCMGHGELILGTVYSQDEITVSLLWAFREFATLTVNPLPLLHGEPLDDLMNISQHAHSESLKLFVVFCFLSGK